MAKYIWLLASRTGIDLYSIRESGSVNVQGNSTKVRVIKSYLDSTTVCTKNCYRNHFCKALLYSELSLPHFVIVLVFFLLILLIDILNEQTCQ